MHQTPRNQSALLAALLSLCNTTELKALPDDRAAHLP